MPTVNIEGVGRVRLSDEFLSLSPEQKDATIQEIASAHNSRKGNITIKTGGPSAADYVEDVAKSGAIGLGRGAIGLAGMAGDLSDLGASGLDKLTGLITGQPGPDRSKSALNNIPTSQSITKGIEENVTGEFYKPKTRAGEYAQTVGEFIPGALAGPGGMVRNAAAFGAIPAVASEAAGGATRGTPLEPYARGAAALASGGVAGVVTAPGNAAGTVSRAAQGLDANVLRQAEALFQEAQAAGMPLTRPEAIQYVTNGATNFGNLQRVVEGQGGMRDFFAGRAAQTDAAAGRAFDQVTPAAPNPHAIGPAVGAAAERTVDDVEGLINRTTRPLYRAAEQQRIPAHLFQQVRSDPVFQEGLRRVRNDEWIGPTLRGLPDDSVAVIDAIKKQLDETGRNLSSPTSGTAQNNYAASIVGGGKNRMVAAADAATGSTPTQVGTYELARSTQQRLREERLQPILDGPIGKIAAKDTTTQKAIDVLFPQNPLPNSAQAIETAVRAVSQRNAYAARNLVRAHLEMTFNEATQNLASGANSYGGAKFAAIVRGNPQQAANLEAAIRALPNGDNIYQGVDRFLTILEAQGQRQAIGSQTAFNTEVLQDLRQGKLAAEAGSAVLSGGLKLPAKISERIERWRMGRNVDELAYLFTDPTAGREFARMASAGSGANSAGSIIRLVGLALRPGQSSPNKEK
jgi:hypothetical protein